MKKGRWGRGGGGGGFWRACTVIQSPAEENGVLPYCRITYLWMGGKNVPKTRHPLLEGRKGERKEERKN